MPKMRIGPLQLLAILANICYGKSLGYTNGILARAVGNDAMLAMTIAFLVGMAVMPVLVWLARQRGTETPANYIPKLLGRWLGVPVMLGLGIFFLVSFMTSAITIEQHINDYLMTETPLIVFVVGYTLLILYGVYLGLEVIARLSVLGLLFNMMFNLALATGSLHHVDMSRLLPLFDHGLLPVMAASSSALTDVFMATGAALMLMPSVAQPAKWLKYCWWGLGVGAILVIPWSLFEVTVLGSDVTALYLISCMQLARSAELSIYVHRYEMIMVVLFVYGVISQSVVLLHCSVDLLSAVLPKRVNRGFLITAVALLSIPLQWYLAIDRERYGSFLAAVWPPATLILALGLPLLLCLVALFRRPSVASGQSKGG